MSVVLTHVNGPITVSGTIHVIVFRIRPYFHFKIRDLADSKLYAILLKMP